MLSYSFTKSFLIGILLIVAISLYFKFTKKKKSGSVSRGITRSTLFRNLKDEAQLRDYVAETLANNVDKEKMTNTLLKKGWNKEQINYVIRRLQSSKK